MMICLVSVSCSLSQKASCLLSLRIELRLALLRSYLQFFGTSHFLLDCFQVFKTAEVLPLASAFVVPHYERSRNLTILELAYWNSF